MPFYFPQKEGWRDRAEVLSRLGGETICVFRAGARRAKETLSPLTLHLKPCAVGGTCTGSGENKPQLRMSLELDSGETAEEEKHLAKGQDVHHQLAGEKSLGGMEREGLGELVSEEPGRKILTWVQL